MLAALKLSALQHSKFPSWQQAVGQLKGVHYLYDTQLSFPEKVNQYRLDLGTNQSFNPTSGAKDGNKFRRSKRSKYLSSSNIHSILNQFHHQTKKQSNSCPLKETSSHERLWWSGLQGRSTITMSWVRILLTSDENDVNKWKKLSRKVHYHKNQR